MVFPDDRRLKPKTLSSVVIKQSKLLASIPLDNDDMSADVGFGFDAVNKAARPCLTGAETPVADRGRVGAEYVARNPKRTDRRSGSFKINLMTGRWADFATGDKGGDVISLTAYLHDLSQREALIRAYLLLT
jgi:hypothetical protein